MGTTFKGAPKSNTVTELGQIVDALRQDFNPAFEKYAMASVDKAQDDAAKKVQSMYASGMSADDIATEITNGKHPDLEGKYTASVVNGYYGQFEAAKVIKEIEKNKGEYDHTVQSIETFWKGYLPKFTDQSSSWTTGFATIFNKYKATELIKDAEKRGTHWENKKVEGIHSVIDAYVITEGVNANSSDLWQIVESYRGSLPKVDGYKENSFISKETANNAMYLWAFKKYQDADTVEELEIAKSVIYDQRITKDGDTLPSLFDTGKKEYTTLLGQIENKMIAIENQSYQRTEREYVSERRDLLIELIATDDDARRKELLEQLKTNHGDLYTTYNQILQAKGKVEEKSGDILALQEEVLRGQWNHKDGLLERLQSLNATDSTILATLKSQISAEQTTMYGWDNPYKDVDVSNLNKKLAVILKSKIPSLAKYDDGKITQMLADRVEQDVRAEYIEWIKKYPRPDKKASPKDQMDWFEKKEKWLTDKYEEKLKIYNNEAWLTSFKNLMELEEKAGFDLEAVPSEYYTAVVEDVVKTMKVVNPTDNTSPIQFYQTSADRDLMSIRDVIVGSKEYQDLLTSSGFKSLIEQNPKFKETLIDSIMEGLGLETKDYSEQLNAVADSIGAFANTITLPNLVENDLFTWGKNEKTESIEARNLAFTQGLETILGREATQGLLYSIQQIKPEALTTLAQIFNMSSEDFKNMVNTTLGNKTK